MREITKKRVTKETEIELTLNLDGQAKFDIRMEEKFFKHMLEQFCYHSGFNLKLNAKSLDGNSHHLIEDVAITLGSAIKEALGDKKGIKRYASCILPMDEALILVALDISGRPYCSADVILKDERTSDFESVLLAHFLNSFAQNLGLTLHVKELSGTDTHHIIEATFKALARAIKEAVAIDTEGSCEVPSTKGVL